MNRTRYAVVGYGGPAELATPHSFTAANRIFNNQATSINIDDRRHRHNCVFILRLQI